MTQPIINEKTLSQDPAIQQLVALGYQYLTSEQVKPLREGNNNILLLGVLREQLARLNRIHYQGAQHHFSEANIQQAIEKLHYVKDDGPQKTSEAVYNLLTLGTALEQSIAGNKKSFTLNYIDWQNPANNQFHVVEEYRVEKSLGNNTCRPDIVCFVNGIPLCVIECKSPAVDVKDAMSQMMGYQDNIPKLFSYVQLVMATNKSKALYATTGTIPKFWGLWHELDDTQQDVEASINPQAAGRIVSPQDKAIYSLCRPERLLELTYSFILFEEGQKKIARYQQFFVTREAMARIKRTTHNGSRTGGLIWHTQGSGKSLTMVMLTRALMRDKDISNPRIMLVTDRINLDKQLGDTFIDCDLTHKKATSGRDLVMHLKNKVGIITTLIHKFETALSAEDFTDDSADIFVLVDESHRSNFGTLEQSMRQILPNACYLGFTGTPLLKKHKHSMVKFGGLIEPHYSIRQAVKDEAVVPLLYRGVMWK